MTLRFRTLGCTALLGLATLSQANITSSALGLTFSANQFDAISGGPTNSVYSASGTAYTYGAISDPSTTTTLTYGYETTATGASATLITSNATTLDFTGDLNATGVASGNPPTEMYSDFSYAFVQFNFALDAPGTLTVQATNTITNIVIGNGFTQITDYVDGNYIGPFGSWSVGAGSHSVQLYVQGRGLSGNYLGNSYGSFGSGQVDLPYEITVQSTPEPATLAGIGLAVLGLMRRRRR